MKTIILATHNNNKVKELQQLLQLDEFQNLRQKIEFQNAENYPMPDEPFITFVENALHKARHISCLSQSATIADDSGLCIPELHNLPGVKSARFYEEDICKKSLPLSFSLPLLRKDVDVLNNQLLATLLPPQGLKAYYVANLVYMQDEYDSNPLVVQGFWHGIIKPVFQGEDGFGYDPMFYPWINGAYQTQTVAQLSLNIKNQYSHRATAFKNLLLQLQKIV